MIIGYNEYRKICDLVPVRRIQDFIIENFGKMDEDIVEKLIELYGDVDDVDLFVGGFLERNYGDSPLHVGPIFKCIIADTFAR